MEFELVRQPKGNFRLRINAPLAMAEKARQKMLAAGNKPSQVLDTDLPSQPKWRGMFLNSITMSEPVLRKQISDLLDPELYGEPIGAWSLKVRLWAQSLAR